MDYLGIFDDVAAALEFDDQSVKQVVSNIQELKDKRPEAMQKCLAFFSGCDRNVQGYEGLIAAQQCLPCNEVRETLPKTTAYSAKSGKHCRRTPFSAHLRRITNGFRRFISRCSRQVVTAN